MSVQPSIDPVDLLRQHSVQVTAQQLAVLRAVADRPHGTADDAAEVVRTEIGSISCQGVYDDRGALVDKGLVRRFRPAGSYARYEQRMGEDHHPVYRSCGHTFYIDCAIGSASCLHVADDRGYEIDEAEVVYRDRCYTCREGADGT